MIAHPSFTHGYQWYTDSTESQFYAVAVGSGNVDHAYSLVVTRDTTTMMQGETKSGNHYLFQRCNATVLPPDAQVARFYAKTLNSIADDGFPKAVEFFYVKNEDYTYGKVVEP